MLEGNTLRAKLVENTPAQGALGFKGERGYSNYEIAVKNGYVGTEQEWIDHFGVDLTNYLKTTDIIDNVTTNNSSKPLSAAQGRYLKNYIDTYTENEIGDTPSLDTTSKIVVGAINEVKSDLETVSATILSSSDIVDLIYPVNSIYMSVNSTSPATLFGGTWVQLKDKFLLGSGDTYTNGNTGGAATVTLQTSEIPGHTHNPSSNGSNWVYASTAVSRVQVAESSNSGIYVPAPDNGIDGWKWSTTSSTGGSGSHNNMPPYLVVYMWKRTE